MKVALTLALLVCVAPGAAAQDSTAIASGSAEPETLARVVTLPAVEVSTSRAGENAPLARSVLGRDDLKKLNWGQDTPMALSTQPGVYAYSDAGNGIGYSYLFIRGFPQRRISVLINGVPLNDPESHEVYWIDHPDLLASGTEVQVQRGVGSALYGSASVGGSVNVETTPFTHTPAGGVTFGVGSFATRRLMAEASSGPLSGGWDLYGRYSRIETDGYRERSDTQLWSYALSARRRAGAHTLRFNLYGGPEETHLAYLGVPRPYLDGAISGDADRDRLFNPLQYDGERDHFFEPHYEFIHTWALNPKAALTQTVFYFDGEGYFDEQRFGRELAEFRLTPWATTDSTLFPRDYYRDTDGDGNLDRDAQNQVTVERADVVRKRWIRNRHFGWVPRLRMEHDGGTMTVGGELRAHDGRHVGSLISGSGLPPGTPPDYAYYDYHPRTLSAGVFAREELRLQPQLRVTVDLGLRYQGYDMRGDRFDGVSFDQTYLFALPRLGLTWTPDPRWTVFGAAAYSSREPSFRDLYDAEGAGSVPLYANGVPLVRPERVKDYELGVTWKGEAAAFPRSFGANLFRMNFSDELVYAGQFNTDLGYPTVGNAAKSIHQGVELTGRMDIGEQGPAHPHLGLAANLTLSDNHFVHYSEFYGPTPADEVKYDGNAIGFFPATIAQAAATFGWRSSLLDLEAQHAGRIYVDNTESQAASIAPRTVLNLRAAYSARLPGTSGAEVSVRVLNVLDHRYETSGYMDYDSGGNLVPHLIPAATRQVLGELRLTW